MSLLVCAMDDDDDDVISGQATLCNPIIKQGKQRRYHWSTENGYSLIGCIIL